MKKKKKFWQGTVISFSKQLLNHKTTVSRIVSLLGDEKSTEKNLSKCIYTVGIGNNDYINNYLMPQFYPTSSLHMPDQYAALLIEQYSQQLKVTISVVLYIYICVCVSIYTNIEFFCRVNALIIFFMQPCGLIKLIFNTIQLHGFYSVLEINSIKPHSLTACLH